MNIVIIYQHQKLLFSWLITGKGTTDFQGKFSSQETKKQECMEQQVNFVQVRLGQAQRRNTATRKCCGCSGKDYEGAPTVVIMTKGETCVTEFIL